MGEKNRGKEIKNYLQAARPNVYAMSMHVTTLWGCSYVTHIIISLITYSSYRYIINTQSAALPILIGYHLLVIK